MAAHLVYSRSYDIGLLGLEHLHPFDSHKYSRAWKLLRRRFGRALEAWSVSPEREISRGELASVHAARYLQQDLRSSAYLARALELPFIGALPTWLIDRAVLRPMRRATMGTLLAARAALDSGSFAINLAGGFHHACADRGEGFCVYADVGVAVQMLRASGELGHDDQLLYIDLDAHQGNGVARIFADDPTVALFDMYNADIYPRDAVARRRVDRDLPLGDGCSEELYLATLEQHLPDFVTRWSRGRRPRLAIYNAGTDVFFDDSLGGLTLSTTAVLRRDRYVAELLREAGIPWVMVLSGGYSRQSYQLVAASVGEFLERWAGGVVRR
jgi:histone deacetylase 11